MRYPVLLHGFTGCAAAWSDIVVDGLASAGHTPRLVDLPGHGVHSGEEEPSRFTLAATLASIPDPSGDALVGYSMGGRLALHYAVAHPERVSRLVLESASPGLPDEHERSDRRRADEQLAARIEDEGTEPFVREWEALPLFASHARLREDVRQRLRALRLANDPRSLAASLRGIGTGALPSLWPRLSGLRVPTLILAGEEDPRFAAIGERMAEALPMARLRVVRGAGHTPHLERPDAWLEEVVGFLSTDLG